jgi:integrase
VQVAEMVELNVQHVQRPVDGLVLSAEQVTAIAERLHEPYATLVLFLYATGLRIGEAAAIKWSDFTDNA